MDNIFADSTHSVILYDPISFPLKSIRSLLMSSDIEVFFQKSTREEEEEEEGEEEEGRVLH